MSRSGSNGKHAVKVVIINTQYIDTDSSSFKSVVQSFTGKDAIVQVHAPAPAPAPATEYSGRQIGGQQLADSSVNLLRGKSFKDIDRYLADLPYSLDEIFQMITD